MSKKSRSRLWTRWLSRKPAAELPTPNLRFEQLEDRLAPATFTWTGGSTGPTANANWSNPGNWQLGVAPTPAVPLTVTTSQQGQATPTAANEVQTFLVPSVAGTFSLFNIQLGSSPVVIGANLPTNVTLATVQGLLDATYGSGNSSASFVTQPSGDRLFTVNFQGTLAATNTNQITGSFFAAGAVNDLVFPAGAARLSNFDDLPTGTVINQITVQGGGYVIAESPDPTVNLIVLGNGSPSSGNVTVNTGAGPTSFAPPVLLATNGDQTINVGLGSTLSLAGTIIGSVFNNMNKDGAGRLTLGTANPNLLGGVKINQGILEVKHVQSLGPTAAQGGTETVVGFGGSLYLNNVTQVTGTSPITSIGEQVRLSGGGQGNQGALYDEAGNTAWSGPVILVSQDAITSPNQATGKGTVIGANTGTILSITGQISDFGAASGLIKEGAGEVRLDSTTGNTYRGQTNINNGILTATHKLSLGDSRPKTGTLPNGRPLPGDENSDINSDAFQSLAAGTVINQDTAGRGQLRLEAPVGSPGFTVVGEYLVLNSTGNDGNGAVYNVRGDNIWAANVILGSSSPEGRAPSIGVAAPTAGSAGPPVVLAVPSSLAISGLVSDPNLPGASLTKVLGGRLILSRANTYTGPTFVTAGTITIRDSQGLGPAGGAGTTTVSSGATLELDVEAAYANSAVPRYDDLGRDTWADSVTNDSQKLLINETLTINGRGVNAFGAGVAPGLTNGGLGALRNMTGINRWSGTVTLGSSEAAIGVEPDGSFLADGVTINRGVNGVPLARDGHPTPDSSYFVSDYSLTVLGTVSGGRGTDFAKRGAGHLILPNANPYFGRTLVEQGWVTVQNNRSLGDSTPNTTFGKTAQQPTIVTQGAAIHIRPPAPGVQLTIQEEQLDLEGIGPTHPYALISQKGALMNLGGSNTVTGDVGLLNSTRQLTPTTSIVEGAGIGVEDVDVAALGASNLTITGDLSDGYRYQQSQADFFTAINQTRTYLFNAGDTVGRISIPYDFGPVGDRLQVYYPDINGTLLFDTGGFVTGVGMATVNYGPGGSSQFTVVVTSGGGSPNPVNPFNIGIQSIAATPRGIVTNTPGSVVKLGSRTLNLQGAGSQTGAKNEVREGTLRVQNDTALGRATIGTETTIAGTQQTTQQSYPVTRTEVADGATLELTGSVAMHEGGVAAGVHIQDEQLALNEYGLQIRVAGQQTARFQLNFAGQLTDQIPTPAGYTAAYGFSPSTLPYEQFLAQQINTKLTNIAANLVLGVQPAATAAQAQAVVTKTGDGVYTVTFGEARFNNFDFSALTIIVLPINTVFVPTVGSPAQVVAALAEVRISGSNAPLVNLSDDSTWRGPVELNGGTRIEVRPNSRLNLLGNINENAANLDPFGSDLVKRDAGDLTLGGATSNYRGTTWLDEGIVTAVSSRSFGNPTQSIVNPTLGYQGGGTNVANGAQLQIQGSLTIAGESLQVQGNGSPTLPSLDQTIRWLSVGPGATNNGAAAPFAGTGAATSGQINSIATDPTDPRVIYIASANGGAWKTKDGGLTWIALFDIGLQKDTNTPQSASPDAAGGLLPLSAMMFGGQIVVAPTNPSILYYGTGDANGQFSGIPNPGTTDNYAGSGVYRSEDGGKTWLRLLANDGSNPIYGTMVTKMIVDPFNADRLYVATGTLRRLPNGTSPLLFPDTVLSSNTAALPRAGVWRYTHPSTLVLGPNDPRPPLETQRWVNLTGTASPNRRAVGGTPGSAPYDAAPNGIGAPGFAGPDDDYRIRFPLGTANDAGSVNTGLSEAATWSDIALVVRGSSHPLYGSILAAGLTGPAYTLYAALGESAQRYHFQPAGTPTRATVVDGIFNAVYRTDNPDYITAFTSGPTWWLGSGTLEPTVTPDAALRNPDRRPGDGFPISTTGYIVVDPAPPFIPPGRNGYITLTAATVVEEIGPPFGYTVRGDNGTFDGVNSRVVSMDLPARDNGNPGRYAEITVYASVIRRESTLSEFPSLTDSLRGELLDIQKSTNVGGMRGGGWIWTSLAGPAQPFGAAVANVRPALGRYDHFIQIGDYLPQSISDTNKSAAAGTGIGNSANEIFLGGLDFVWRSTDGGATWAPLNSTTNNADDRGLQPAEQFHAIAFDTQNRVLFGSDGGLWRWDRFRFSDLNSNLPIVELNSADPHPTDFRQAVGGASSTGTQKWNGNTGDGSSGVWQRVDDISTTATTGLSGSVTGIVRYDPFNPTVLYAARDGFLRKSTDSGVTWTPINPAFEEFGGSPTSGFTGGNDNPFPARLSNAPIYPRSLAMYATDQFPLVVDSLTANRVVVGGLTYNRAEVPVPRLYVSTNSGQNWTSLNTPITPTVIALAGFQGEFRPDARFPTVFEGLANQPDLRTFYVSDGKNIQVTKNRGNSWQSANLPLKTALTGAADPDSPLSWSITAMVVNPVNRDELYVTVTETPGKQPPRGGPTPTASRVWRSIDAGQNWTDISGTFDPDAGTNAEQGPIPNIPTWTIAVDPRSGNLFVGNDNGVWQLVDPSATDPANVARTAGTGTLYWKRFGDGMPNVQVRDIVLNQNSSTLTVATHGRGMFQMFLPDYAANSGAVRAVSGTSRWTGPVTLTGNTRIGAAGTQQIQNGLSAASLDFGGTISSPGGAFTLEKTGRGTVILSGGNTYTGQTIVTEGVLEVKDPNALGAATAAGNTVVRYGAALQVRSDIEQEPITINGDGIYFNGHATGAIRNISGNNVYNGVLTLGTSSFLGAPQPTERDLAQLTIGVDTGSSLRIGLNTTPGVVGRVVGSTDRIITFAFGGTTTPAASRNWGQITATGAISGPLTAVTTRNGAVGPPVVTEVQQFALPLTAGMVTFSSPDFASFVVDPTSATLAADIQAFLNTRVPGAQANANVVVTDVVVGFDKELPGTLILSSDNTAYLGTTQVVAGAVEVRNAQALGPAVAGGAPTRVFDGAAVRIANNAPNTPTIVTQERLILSGSGTPDSPLGAGTGALRNTGGDNTWAGPITLDSLPNFAPTTNPASQVAFGVNNAADTLTVSAAGGITENAAVGQFGLIKVGPGAVRLEQANLYTGVTNVNEGTLRAAHNQALGVNTTSSEVQTIEVFGNGSFQLNVNGQPTGTINAGPLTAGSTAAQLDALIEAAIAGTAGGGDVLVSETPNSSGRVYTVTFRGRFAGQNVPILLAENVTSGVTVTIDTPQQGGFGTVVGIGASLELDGNNLHVAETLTINGPGVSLGSAPVVRVGALGNRDTVNGAVGGFGANFYDGTITFGSASAIGAQPGTTLTVMGRVLGRPNDPIIVAGPTNPAAAELTKVGGGTVVFPNNKEFRGRTSVAEGALQILSAGSLGVGRNEVQTVRVTGTFGNTRYTLSFFGETTDPITLQNGLTTNIVNALTLPRDGGAMPAIFAATDVQVTATSVTGVGAEPDETIFTITFQGGLKNTNLPQLTDVSPATPVSPSPFSLPITTITQGQLATPIGANEVVEILVPNTAGSFTLSMIATNPNTGGFPATFTLTTPALPFDATDAQVQAALEALTPPVTAPLLTPPPVGAGNVMVTRTTLPGNTGHVFRLEFINARANMNIPNITGQFTTVATVRSQTVVDGVAGLDAATNTVVGEAQLVNVSGTNGTYRLSFTNPFTGLTTTSTRLLLFNATAADFQQVLTDSVATGGLGLTGALGEFGYLGSGNVTVTRFASTEGFQYLVQFTGNVATGNVGLGNVNLLPITVVPGPGAVSGVTVQLQDGAEGTEVLTGAALKVQNNGFLPAMRTDSVTLNGDGVSEQQVVSVSGTAGTYQLRYINPVTGLPVTGTRTLTFDSANPTATATADAFQLALTDSVATGGLGLGALNVRVTRAIRPGGVYQYVLEFVNGFGNVNLAPVQLVPATGTVAGAVTTLQDGATTGALDMVTSSASITWDSPVILAGTAGIGVDAGQQLTISRPITDRNPYGTPTLTLGPTNVRGTTQGFGVNKVGPGTLQYTDTGVNNPSGVNDYTGTTTVRDGTLLLNYSPIAGNQLAIVGDGNPATFDLVVGDTIGAPGTAVVRYIQGNQIADAASVRVNSDGLFNLNGLTDTIGALSVVGGTVDTNAGGTGGMLTTGPITMTGGLIKVEDAGLLATAGNTITASAAATIDIGVGATLTTVNGATRGAVTLTDSTLTARANSSVLTGALTLNGTTGSTATFGNDSMLNTGGNLLSLTNSSLTGTVGVDLLTGAVSLNASTLSLGNGPSAVLNTGGQAITATNGSALAIGTGPGATLTTVNGATRGAVTLTDSTYTAGANSLTQTGAFTLQGTNPFPASSATFGNDSTLDTGGNLLTITNSTLTGTTGVDLLTGAVSLTTGTLNLGNGPSAVLNTGGQGITATAGSNITIGTGPGATLTTVNGATRGAVQLTNSTLNAGANSTVQTGTLTLDGSAPGSASSFGNDSSLDTGGSAVSLTNSSLTGTTGVDLATGAVTLVNSTLDLGNGPSASLNTSGQAINLSASSHLTIGTGPGATLTGGALTATGASTVATGANSTTNLASATLTGSSLTTGAGSTATVTGALSATGTLAGVGVQIAGTLGAGSVALNSSKLDVQTTGTATFGDLALADGHVLIAAPATATTTGTVSVTFPTSATPASDITGTGVFRLGGTGDRTVNVADGAPAADLLITSGLTALGAQRLIKTGTGRLELAPVGTTFPNAIEVDFGDLQVDTVTAAVQLAGATASLSGTGTVGTITGVMGGSPAVGTVTPGTATNPAGDLTSGASVWGANTTFAVYLSNASGTHPIVPSSDYSSLQVNGSLAINGAALAISAVPVSGTNRIEVGDRFVIINATGPITGMFAGGLSVFIGGQKYSLEYTTNQVTIVKTRATTAITALTGVINPAQTNETVTFTATVTAELGAGAFPSSPDTPDRVEFVIDGTSYFANVSPTGVATKTMSFPTAGFHTVTAKFEGDNSNFEPSALVTLTPTEEVVAPVAGPATGAATTQPANGTGSAGLISPNASVGVQDTFAVTATVAGVLPQATPTVRVKVYTSPLLTPGSLVRTATGAFGALSGRNLPVSGAWDGKNDGGTFVADGTYYVVLEYADQFTNVTTTTAASVVVDNAIPTTTVTGEPLPVIAPGTAGPTPPLTTTIGATITEANPSTTPYTWTVEVRNSSNVVVRTLTGTGLTVGAPASTWDGKDGTNTQVPDGTYTLNLTAYDQAGNSSVPDVRTVYVVTAAPTVTLTSGLGTVQNGRTTYGDNITLTAVVDLPANLDGAETLLNGKPVNFAFPFPGGTAMLSANLAFNATLNKYAATVVFDTATGTLLRLGAGTYAGLTATFLPTADFFGAASAPATHIVDRATLRVTGDDKSRPYAAANPPLTYTVTTGDLKYTDTIAVVTGTPVTPATATSNAGTYPIQQGSVAALPNYTVAFTNGTLTVTQIPLTLQVRDETRSRFAPNPTFVVTSADFKNGDTVAVVTGLSLVTTATPGSPTGAYPITQDPSVTPTATNYFPIVVTPGTLTVTSSPTATVVGAGAGSPGQVKVLEANGSFKTAIPFDTSFTGGIRTASADFNQDGVADYVLGTGPGRQAFVRIISGANGATLFQAFPFDNFTGGLFVAAGDMTGDGIAELVVTPDEGGGPRAIIYRGGDFEQIVSYLAIDDDAFRGGIRPALGDLNNDGFADLVVSAGFGGGPRIAMWDGKALGNVEFKKLAADFFAFEKELRNGAFVAVGDVNGDGFGDLIVGAGPGGGPRVKIYSGSSILSVGGDATNPLANFFAGNVNNRGGVKVASKNLDADKFIDVVTGGGAGDRAIATAYKGAALAANQPASQNVLFDFDLDGSLNGVFVG